MLNEIIAQWKFDYNNKKIIFYLEVVGTISSIIASFLISTFPETIHLSWVFTFWTIGSISIGTSSYLRKIAWPTLLMLIYTVFNFIGLYKVS